MEVIGSPITSRARACTCACPATDARCRPSEGWVDGDVLARAAPPSSRDLPWAYPEDLRADVRINVPYRTQLDGSDFAAANCGPTVLGMALESFGVNMPQPDLRGQVLDTENFEPRRHRRGDRSSGRWPTSRSSHGLQAHGLYDSRRLELHQLVASTRFAPACAAASR